ncbi:unnamed protein product [Cylicocyclus nassatus]|uniref:Secreted protein n=1 Tax=Cylicocyclus nassatus TaxID=53992 RepID=A0AA36GX27_CYLNA|nr:unnamed protein product [Cylicocyclus nassatus]
MLSSSSRTLLSIAWFLNLLVKAEGSCVRNWTRGGAAGEDKTKQQFDELDSRFFCCKTSFLMLFLCYVPFD